MRRDINDDGRGTTVRMKCAVFLSIMFSVVALATQASAAERLGSYVALKGGIYSPSASFDLGNVDIETTFEGDTKTGVDGEIAIGHYFLPTLALELGVGYFNGTGSLEAPARGDVDFDVIPVILSGKALIPAGPVDPYGELGIGAYFTNVDVAGNLNTFSGTTTFGLHTGAGVNVNITQKVFLGVEGRYVWADPSFGDQKIKLNDAEYAVNGFKLNGFTTTVAVGFSF